MMLWSFARAKVHEIGRFDDEGSVVETVIITAIFAALALAVGAIIVSKVTTKANNISLN
jgi:hypothetical protein